MAAATATKKGTCLHFRFPASLYPGLPPYDRADVRDRKKDLPRLYSSARSWVAFRKCLCGKKIFFKPLLTSPLLPVTKGIKETSTLPIVIFFLLSCSFPRLSLHLRSCHAGLLSGHPSMGAGRPKVAGFRVPTGSLAR